MGLLKSEIYTYCFDIMLPLFLLVSSPCLQKLKLSCYGMGWIEGNTNFIPVIFPGVSLIKLNELL